MTERWIRISAKMSPIRNTSPNNENLFCPQSGSDTTTVSHRFELQLEEEKRKSVDLPSKLFAVDAHLSGSNVTLSLRLPSQHLVLS
jgi:hypothetical protein